MDCVIVGGGAAGFHAATTCRTLWPEKSVTLIDAESEYGYYRALLPQFMAGALSEDKLFFPKGEKDPMLAVKTGTRVKGLDRTGRTLLLDSGETLSYDRLILAHGGDPSLPGPLAGPPCKGIFPVRDLTQAREAKTWLQDHRQVIVFGGSLVAVKTAVHLRQAGIDVSLVVRRGHILLRALSEQAAKVIEAHLKKMGIRIYANAPLEDIRVEGGVISSLKAGKQWIPCNTILVAAGTSPDISFLEGTGLLADGQLVVSPSLQTSDPRIFAAGDVAVIATPHGEKLSPNTWPQAVSQGKWAAGNLYRKTPIPYMDETKVNAMELHGLAMVILGPPIEDAEVISFTRPEASIHRELFLVAGKLAGGALIGDITAAGALRSLIRDHKGIHPDEAALLRPASKGAIYFPKHPGRTEALILPSKRSRL